MSMRLPVQIGAVLALVALALFPLSAAAQDAEETCSTPDSPAEVLDQPMRFFLTSDGSRSWISAQGRIVAGTADTFAAFLNDLDEVPGDLVLHSPGGRVREGLDLGRAIRAAGLITHIGETRDCEDADQVTSGLCASACAYAFLGGVERHVRSPRFATPSSRIGYHHVYPSAGQDGVGAAEMEAATRAVMGEIMRYVLEMGVDPRLPGLAAQVDRNSLFVPETVTLAALRIDTGLTVATATAMPEALLQAAF